jgi:hypothetical protein
MAGAVLHGIQGRVAAFWSFEAVIFTLDLRGACAPRGPDSEIDPEVPKAFSLLPRHLAENARSLWFSKAELYDNVWHPPGRNGH